MNIMPERINLARNQAVLYRQKYLNPKQTKYRIFNDLNENLNKGRKIHPQTLKDTEDVLAELDGEIYKTVFMECVA